MRALVLVDEHSRGFHDSMRGEMATVSEFCEGAALVTVNGRRLWVRQACLWFTPRLVERRDL